MSFDSLFLDKQFLGVLTARKVNNNNKRNVMSSLTYKYIMH